MRTNSAWQYCNIHSYSAFISFPSFVRIFAHAFISPPQIRFCLPSFLSTSFFLPLTLNNAGKYRSQCAAVAEQQWDMYVLRSTYLNGFVRQILSEGKKGQIACVSEWCFEAVWRQMPPVGPAKYSDLSVRKQNYFRLYCIYARKSISKFQIQVETYVFELSAGNCHR